MRAYNVVAYYGLVVGAVLVRAFHFFGMVGEQAAISLHGVSMPAVFKVPDYLD